LPKLKEFQEGDLDFVKDKGKNEVIDKETGKLYTSSEKPIVTPPQEADPVDDATVKEETTDGLEKPATGN
jgi:hypothetical protein